MTAKGDGSPYITHLDSNTFPACNIHTFIFSNPFLPSILATRSVNASAIPPHKPIFYDPRLSAAITYSRLKRDTLRLALGIQERYGKPSTTNSFGKGTCSGPVVLVHLQNCITWPVIVLGFLAAGWTVTGTNPGYTVTELAHVIAQCEPAVVVCHPGSNGETTVRAAAGGRKVDIVLVERDSDVYGTPTMVPVPMKSNWTSLLAARELIVSPLSVHEANERVAFILWTSGTTGKIKGAMMSHRAVVAGLVQLWHVIPQYGPEERWLAVAPFYHIFGLYNQLLLAPCLGATVVVIPKFNLEEYLRMASIHRATHLHIAPPIAVALAKSDMIDQPWCSLGSVVAATSGGAPLSPEIIQQVWNRTNVLVKMSYGLTETGGSASVEGNTLEATASQLGSCGKPHLGVKVSIIDVDGRVMPADTTGEIILRTPAQMLGYLKDRQATAEALDDLGFHTGDEGYLDQHGNLRITGRIKELIKYKGFQVSPTELEAIIAALPEVQDVAISSVYSNEQGTELPLAYVVPRSAALLRHVRASKELLSLADKVKMAVEDNFIHYKRLRGGVIVIPAIPKSPSGKILRRLLKDQKGVHIDCYPTTGRSKL